MSRDEAIKLLKGTDRKAGDFLVRDSKTYSGNFGLVVRVDRHQVMITENKHKRMVRFHNLCSRISAQIKIRSQSLCVISSLNP